MKPRLSFSVALVLAAAAVCTGCAGRGASPVAAGSVTTTTTSTTITAPSTTTSTPATTSTTTRPPPLSASSRLRIDGIGPIGVGMTVTQARAAAGTGLSLTKEPYCDVLTAPAGPAGVSLIVTTPASGRIELIIVTEPSMATVSGVRVGSTEAEVLATYPGRLRAVNPSLPVHRLVYTAVDPALADRALVFVIDNGRVATMYAGGRDHVEADEICG